MSLSDRHLTLATFVKLELPGGDVRLCDGGVLAFDGEDYAARDAVWGRVAEIPPGDASIGDLAPGGALVLAPDEATPVSTLRDEALHGSRVQAWMGEVDPATGLVGTAHRLADWIVDFTRVRLAKGARTVALELITRLERLFIRNRGNVCSPRWHKSIWAGEKGFDNCTDVEVSVPWGTEAAPSGKAGGSTTPGGGGGRTWLDALR